MDEEAFSEGDFVFKEGEAGDAFFMVKQGVVRLTKEMPSGENLIIAEFGMGEIFGEMSLITQSPRSGNCKFVEAGRLWKLSYERFIGWRSTEPRIYTTIVRNIASLVCTRLNATTREMATLLRELNQSRNDLAFLKESLERSRRGLSGILQRLSGQAK